MTPVLSRAQMRDFDRHAIEACGVPSLVLMENAGRGATDVLERSLLAGRAAGARAVVVCGTGNNGGDGFVVARHLAVRDGAAQVFVVGDVERLTDDARAHLEAWRGLRGDVHELGSGADVTQLERAMHDGDVVVDALFGTGLDRAISGHPARVVKAMNAARRPRFALDLPSGLDADSGAVLGVAVDARVTATFAHHKLGLLTPGGARLAGDVHVVDIGVPGSLVAHVGASAQLLSPEDVRGWLPPREPAVHKASAGHVAVVGGSPGRIGAPQLVARGAMRAGAGLVTVVTWPETATAIESTILEAMTARITPGALVESLDDVLSGKDAVAVGPGLGLGDAARAAVEYVLASWHGPLVVDADALSMFAGGPAVFMAAKQAILTPHPGEAARLLGRSTTEVEADRFRAVRELVAATGAVVVLKGAHTIIASPDARAAVSPVVCPALATAGSGDVLAGIIAALACQLPPFDAACAGVMLHGLAGMAWSRGRGGADRGLLASEIADLLPGLALGTPA